MADVQETNQAAEPSMEEILASIRRIISDEEPTPDVPADDVIELTQEIKTDGTVVDVREEPVAPTPPPPPAPVPPPAPPASPASIPEPEPVKPVDVPPPQIESLISEPRIDVAASALSSLANTVEIERLASEPRTATYLGNGSRTLEDMAVELMRPLLKQWLDENLPGTVERLVQKEIERISRRAKD